MTLAWHKENHVATLTLLRVRLMSQAAMARALRPSPTLQLALLTTWSARVMEIGLALPRCRTQHRLASLDLKTLSANTNSSDVLRLNERLTV